MAGPWRTDRHRAAGAEDSEQRPCLSSPACLTGILTVPVTLMVEGTSAAGSLDHHILEPLVEVPGMRAKHHHPGEVAPGAA